MRAGIRIMGLRGTSGTRRATGKAQVDSIHKYLPCRTILEYLFAESYPVGLFLGTRLQLISQWDD